PHTAIKSAALGHFSYLRSPRTPPPPSTPAPSTTTTTTTHGRTTRGQANIPRAQRHRRDYRAMLASTHDWSADHCRLPPSLNNDSSRAPAPANIREFTVG